MYVCVYINITHIHTYLDFTHIYTHRKTFFKKLHLNIYIYIIGAYTIYMCVCVCALYKLVNIDIPVNNFHLDDTTSHTYEVLNLL